MRDFDYIKTKTLNEAVALLEQHGAKAKVMAGGTDLINQMRLRSKEPDLVIDIKNIPGLDTIKWDNQKGLIIGALTKLKDIVESKEIQSRFPILCDSAVRIGSVQIRNVATIGGNLCNAAPSADMAPPLIVLGASVTIQGRSGEREMPVEDFFKGPGQTALAGSEILTKIIVPPMPARSAAVYLKGRIRGAMDLAMAGVACFLTLDETGRKCTDVKIALGAVAPIPMRARESEGEIRGKTLSDELFAKAAKIACCEAKPISDCRCSAEYRVDMTEVLTKRALSQTWGIAAGGQR